MWPTEVSDQARSRDATKFGNVFPFGLTTASSVQKSIAGRKLNHSATQRDYRSPHGVMTRATRVRAQSNEKIKPSEQWDRKIAYPARRVRR